MRRGIHVGLRLGPSERGEHEEMTSLLDKLAGKQLDLLDEENTGKKLNKFQYQTVQEILDKLGEKS